MRTAFLVLAHTRLDRTAELVRALIAAGAPVVVHIDQRVAKAQRDRFATIVDVGAKVISTRRSDWGGYGLVAATLDGVRALREMAPGSGHVCLLSGACLPIRPLAELEAILAENAGVDFIESVPVSEQTWVQDGLSLERFTLWHFVSWRRRKWIFDRLVALQRGLGVTRRMPEGLEPHLGQQWWCLSIETINAILDHDDLPRWEAFFRWSWIPDEGFFQTLVRHVRRDQEPHHPIHLNRFNSQGRPAVFHDDHGEVLSSSNFFFARKIDPDAEGLYQHFLTSALAAPAGDQFHASAVGTVPSQSRLDDPQEHRGQIGAYRLPVGTTPLRAETARPYVVIISNGSDLLSALKEIWAGRNSDYAIHGRLFRAGRPAEWETQTHVWLGNIPNAQLLRDTRPAQFLSNVVKAAGERPTVFFMAKGDETRVRHQLSIDANARLVLIGTSAWAQDYLSELQLPVEPLESEKRRRRRKTRKPTPLWSWHRVFEIEQFVNHQTASPEEKAVAALETIVFGDLENPAGWKVQR